MVNKTRSSFTLFFSKWKPLIGLPLGLCGFSKFTFSNLVGKNQLFPFSPEVLNTSPQSAAAASDWGSQSKKEILNKLSKPHVLDKEPRLRPKVSRAKCVGGVRMVKKKHTAVSGQGFIAEVVVNSWGKELVIISVQGPFFLLCRMMCINLKKMLLDSFPTGRNDHDVGRFAPFLYSCQACAEELPASVTLRLTS